jgi:hypothetical protein
MRAWMIYPCRVACADAAQGRMRISADPEGQDEHIDLRNVSSDAIGLDGYLVVNGANVYDLGAHQVSLAPGETMQLYSLGDTGDDTRLRKHWGMNRPLLINSGMTVELRTFDDRSIDCYAWGSSRC